MPQRLSQFSLFLSWREEAKTLIPNICSLADLAEIEETWIGKIAKRARSMPHHPLGTWHSLITRGAKLIQTECLEIPCGSRCMGRMGPDAQPLLTLLHCPVPWYRNLRLVPGWRFIILEARSMMTFVYFCMLHNFHKMWHTHDAAIACHPTPEACTASRVRHRIANGPRSASVYHTLPGLQLLCNPCS